MYKGTTPTFTFTFPEDFDPSLASDILLTFSADRRHPILEIEREEMTISDGTISVWLSQEQTVKFPTGNVYVQFNFDYSDGNRVASIIQTIVWNRNLHSEVIG